MEEKTVSGIVDGIISDLRKNSSKRFSKSDFQSLVYGVLNDQTFKVKKYLIKGTDLITTEDTGEINSGMRNFLDKLLKHAGMAKNEEREAVINSFEFGVNDIDWIIEAVDEAMWLYTECGKNMSIFRDKLRKLSFSKIERTGKNAGKISYRKGVVDKEAAIARKVAKMVIENKD